MHLDDVVVVGNSSDNPFAIDVAYAMGQAEDISDQISMKTFANSEFCPRFISDENDFDAIGNQLIGKTVVIVSTSSRLVSRNNLATLLRSMGDYEAASPLYERSLAIRERALGPEHRRWPRPRTTWPTSCGATARISTRRWRSTSALSRSTRRRSAPGTWRSA